MRFFAELWPDLRIRQQPADQLPWFHVVVLLTKVSDAGTREWYAARAIAEGCSRPLLEAHIKAGLHLRQGAALTNFEARIDARQAKLAVEVLKDPYHFDFLGLGDEAHERDIESAFSATSPGFCWSWAPASPSSAASTASRWTATNSSSTCSSITRV